MMRWIIGASLQSRLVVAALAVGLIYFGFTILPKVPIETLPEFSQPYVEIQTEAQGLSAPEVEALITVPMEADMLNGTPWVEEIRSQYRWFRATRFVTLLVTDANERQVSRCY